VLGIIVIACTIVVLLLSFMGVAITTAYTIGFVLMTVLTIVCLCLPPLNRIFRTPESRSTPEGQVLWHYVKPRLKAMWHAIPWPRFLVRYGNILTLNNINETFGELL